MAHLVNGHKVHYVYGKEKVQFFNHGNQEIVNKPTIQCIITKNNEEIASAKVRPHHEDSNNKIVGRFYAFKKAVSTIPDKKLRTALFNDYLQHCKLPK